MSYHFIASLTGCKNNFTDVEPAIELARAVAGRAGLTVVEVIGKHIGPGVTVVAILTQSHMVIDTWPEEKYADVELHTCGNPTRGVRAFSELIRYFAPSNVYPHLLRRGPGAHAGD